MTLVKQLRAQRNADFLFSIRVRDDDGDPTVFSAARMQVRETEESADPALVDASIANGQITVNATGYLVIRIPQATLAAVDGSFDTGVYDLVATRTADGAVLPLMEGSFILRDGVTR